MCVYDCLDPHTDTHVTDKHTAHSDGDSTRSPASRMPCPDGEQALHCEHMEQAVYTQNSVCVCEQIMTLSRVCAEQSDQYRSEKTAGIKQR